MAEQLSKKNDADLKKLLAEKREELWKFRFSVAGAKVRNVKEGANLRKEIARILTELNARRHEHNT